MPRFCPFRLEKDKNGNDMFAACIGNADCPSYHSYCDKEYKYQEVCLKIEDMRERYIKTQEEKVPEDMTIVSHCTECEFVSERSYDLCPLCYSKMKRMVIRDVF